jgi:hypothetical protein
MRAKQLQGRRELKSGGEDLRVKPKAGAHAREANCEEGAS